MAFKDMNWQYSDWTDPTSIEFTEGQRTLKIVNASFDDEIELYIITFSDMETGAQFDVRFYLSYNGAENTRVRGTLQTLKRALAGPSANKGLPHPSTIIGGVVCANVTAKYLDSGSKVPKIYSFEPVVQEIVYCADIDQYYIGQEYESEASE